MSPKSWLSVRDIVTPVTFVTFAVSTLSGLMLLAHWNAGLVRFSHEWLSVVFAAAAAWHLARNWRGVQSYLARQPARMVIAGALAICLAVTALTASTATVSPGAVFRALGNARLEVAAPAFGLTPEAAVALLNEAAIAAAPGQTLGEIGGQAGIGGPAVVSILATKKRS